MTNELSQELLSAVSDLLKKTSVQLLLVAGATMLLYHLTLETYWILLGITCVTIILIRANRRAAGPRGGSHGPAGGPVDFSGNGDGNGGGDGG